VILALKVSLVVWAIGRGLSAMFEQTSALEKLWDVGLDHRACILGLQSSSLAQELGDNIISKFHFET